MPEGSLSLRYMRIPRLLNGHDAHSTSQGIDIHVAPNFASVCLPSHIDGNIWLMLWVMLLMWMFGSCFRAGFAPPERGLC